MVMVVVFSIVQIVDKNTPIVQLKFLVEDVVDVLFTQHAL